MAPTSAPAALRWLALILLIAVANYLSGRLGLLLALPPGFSTAVWPPSGIALAALLLLGYGVWPGVWIGSFAMNVWLAMQSGPVTDWLAASLIAGSIGAGSTLQALLGAGLIRRYVGFPNPLLFERPIAAFLLLGGPVSCLVGASVGIGTLVLAGVMPLAIAPFQWWTWYMGDTIGVLTIMPLLLIALAQPREVWRRRSASVGLPLMITFAVAVSFFVYASRVEQARIDAANARHREHVAAALKGTLDRAMDTVYALAGLFDSGGEVSRQRFRDFSARVLPRLPAVQAISWNPRIDPDTRSAYEASAQADGLREFRISEFGDGRLRPALLRELHFPVYYIEPARDNAAALGYDLYSEPLRRAVLQKAWRSGRPAVSEPLRLVQEAGDQHGVLLVHPVHGRSPDSPPAGFVTVVLRMQDIVNESLPPQLLGGMALALDDVTAGPARELVAPTVPARLLAPGAPWSATPIEFGDRRWQLRLAPTASAVSAQKSLVAWTVLAGGMMFTSILGAFLLAVTGRAIHVRQLMDQTQETNHRLRETQHQLVQAEKLASLGSLVAGVAHEINTPVGIGVTAASHLQEQARKVERAAQAGTLDQPQFQRFLDQCRQATEILLTNLRRASELVQSFKRVAVDQATGERRRINLKDYLSETLLSLRPKFKHTPHKVALDCPPDLELVTEPGALSQIVANLLINSLVHGFTPERPGAVDIRVSEADGRITLRFADDGRGIAPEHLTQLFEPFFTTRRGQGGTGLGLSIVYNLVTSRLAGTITVDSQPGKGAVFTITFPAGHAGRRVSP